MRHLDILSAALGGRQPQPRFAPIDRPPHDNVDDPRHRVRAVKRGGAIQQNIDPFDRRRAYMTLSPDALAGMRSYVASLRQQGLPIA